MSNKTTLTAGTSKKVEVKIFPPNATNRNVSWSTSDKNVVMLSGIGPSDGKIAGYLYAGKPGTATVTASVNEYSSDSYSRVFTDTIEVEVMPKNSGGTLDVNFNYPWYGKI